MTQRVDKDSLPLNQPRRTPSHPTKSHIVKTKVDGKEKIIRFGEQGASTAGKPKAGESDRMKQKRASFKSRHAKNIAKGPSSPAYWANKVKWAEGGEVNLARGGNAAMALLEQMRRSGNSPEFNAVEASMREQRARPRRSVVPPPQQRQVVAQPQAENLPLPPIPPAMRPDENPPPEAPRSPRAFDESNPHVATAIQMAERYNLPRDVFLSLVRQESNFNPAAVSPRGAIGLGQLMPGTARELNVDPNDPVQNLEGSARYLRRMIDRFGDIPLALAAYNAGPTRVALSGNTIPNIRETQNYVQTIMRNSGASGFAEGGLAELEQKYAEGGTVVTAYDPDAVEARIRSVEQPEGYAEGGRVGRVAGAVRRTLRDELRDIEAEVRGERPSSLGVTVARGMGEGGGGIAGTMSRIRRGKPEFFSLNEGPSGVPEVTRISPERMRELQALDDAMIAEANASRPALNVRQQDVDRLAADLTDNPMRAADEMAALREAEALRRAGSTLADDLADNLFASRPEVMRVYHAGAEFDTPSPGLFTNPDRAAVESFQQQMRAPRLHELEISPRKMGGDDDVYEAARRYGVYSPDTPAGQYLEQGDNAVFGEAADILAELRRRGFDSVRLDDGVGREPSVVVLDPGIVRRYAEGGEVMSDEEYDRRLLSRMKAQTGRVTEPTRAEQMQALRTAGSEAAQLAADVLLPQSPLDAALMVALGPGGRAARLAGAGALAALEPSEAEASRFRRLVRAYHGSPHKFEEFDISKIGTGEGAQAYGRGLYFAENEDVARDYRNKLSKSTIETASGRLHPYSSSAADEIAGDLMVGANPQVRYPAEDAIGSMVRGQSLDNAIAQMRRNYDHLDPANLDEAERLLRQNNPRVISSGHMYEVDINANPREFLNWDEPLSRQAPEVRESLQRFGLRVDPEGVEELERLRNAPHRYGEIRPMPSIPYRSPDPTGQEIYQRLLRMDPEEARIALMQSGIPGTRYLDAGSRGVGGTYNYAVFDPEIIDITRRYAEGGLAELEQKYAEGGSVDAGPAQYNADAVDALVKQIEAEYV